ncbi:hypothetical protein TL16_g02145 [Triparma laevis f. inornata]|uniref:Uncharacterized protein n=1 Tax=Triparma laevis f. inornata TaxID=1714386 RepID=A0A9W6ZV40_9STRA|nr:hypothetical protein TL16_g02145 [Triparma laevis f. inornata]
MPDKSPKIATMPTKRFDTTTESGLRAIVARRDELEPRSVIAERLKARKIANTKTSIVFGFDENEWQTDAQFRQKNILRAEKRDIAAEKKKMHDMKMHLKFHTNISFGGEGEPIDYTQDSKMADPTGHIHEYTGVLNKQVEKFIKKSSLYFGNDMPIYKSSAHAGMESGVRGENNNDFQQTQEETAKLKKDLRACHYSLGDDKIEYTTDHQRGYKAYTTKEMESVRGSLAQEVKADLRKCHFELGHDEVLWETDLMRTQRVSGAAATEGRDPAKDREHAKQLKSALQKTSFIIGDNEEYF